MQLLEPVAWGRLRRCHEPVQPTAGVCPALRCTSDGPAFDFHRVAGKLDPVSRLFEFPKQVNELSARLVATGVVTMGLAFVITGWRWILIPLAYGFLARVAAGPRFSPLGLVVTKVLTPRFDRRNTIVPGAPKRFAQAIGAMSSITASVLVLSGHTGVARIVIAGLVAAASLEAFVGFCCGCWMFAQLMRAGIVPESVCAECNDLSLRRTTTSV